MRAIWIAAAGFSLVTASGRASATDAKTVWKDAINQCAKNDLIRHGILFMGLGSDFGPGDIFVKSGGDLRIYFPASEYIKDEKVIQKEKEFNCSDVKNGTFKVSANADLSKLIPVSLNIDHSHITGITLEPTTMRWDHLVLGYWAQAVHDAPPRIKSAIIKDQHPVIFDAVHVSGLKTKMTFDDKTKIDVKKLPIPAGVTAELDKNGTLTIDSKDDFYVAAVMIKYDPKNPMMGVAPGKKLLPVSIVNGDSSLATSKKKGR